MSPRTVFILIVKGAGFLVALQAAVGLLDAILLNDPAGSDAAWSGFFRLVLGLVVVRQAARVGDFAYPGS